MIRREPERNATVRRHVPGVAGSEVLSALVKAACIKPRHTLPPRFLPPSAFFHDSASHSAPFWERMQDFVQPGDVVLAELERPRQGQGSGCPMGLQSSGNRSLLLSSSPSRLTRRGPPRRQSRFIGDGTSQMTAQKLSAILRRGPKPVIFAVNNNGCTMERLILGPTSNCNDINQWRYAEAAWFFDT
jgi:TPP-dependent 2-oxoacid decarboxylase